MSEGRRCQVCCHDQGLAVARNGMDGMWFCRNFIACNARARRRLGIPPYQVRMLASRERAQMNDARHA